MPERLRIGVVIVAVALVLIFVPQVRSNFDWSLGSSGKSQTVAPPTPQSQQVAADTTAMRATLALWATEEQFSDDGYIHDETPSERLVFIQQLEGWRPAFWAIEGTADQLMMAADATPAAVTLIRDVAAQARQDIRSLNALVTFAQTLTPAATATVTEQEVTWTAANQRTHTEYHVVATERQTLRAPLTG